MKPVTLSPGDLVSIDGKILFISRAGYNGEGLRATYLSDGSFHEPFNLGDFKSVKLPEGSEVTVVVGK